jgi:hypothetical protein
MNDLNQNEKQFCSDLILDFSFDAMRDDYNYQVGDGVEAVLTVLPLLLGANDEEDCRIKAVLFVTLFNLHPTTFGKNMSDLSTSTILNQLWEIDPKSANSMFYGYLKLAPKYGKFCKTLLKDNNEKKHGYLTSQKTINLFLEKNETDIDMVIENRLAYELPVDLNEIDVHILERAFELLPSGTDDPQHIKFLDAVFPIFSKKYLDDSETSYNDRHRFISKLTHFILASPTNRIDSYVKPFVDDLTGDKNFNELFNEFAIAHSSVNCSKEFWQVWELFFKKIVELLKSRDWLINLSRLSNLTLLVEEAKAKQRMIRERANKKYFLKKSARSWGIFR